MGWDVRFRETHDYAVHHGYAMGFPNFHEANYGDGVVRGTHLLKSIGVSWRDVPAVEFGGVGREDVPAMFRGATDYAGRQGYPAAMPNFHEADYGQGRVYGTFLFAQGSVDFQDVPRDTLGVYHIEDVPGMMRAAHDYGIAQGYPAAFPTFHQADHGAGVVCGVILIKPGFVEWRDIPADLLGMYSNRDDPWAIILCHLSDVAPAPNARSRWVDFFSEGGTDESNVYRYWDGVSFGTFHPSESRVFGFFDLGHTTTELNTFVGGQQRQKLAEWGINAAQANHVPLDKFPLRVIGVNSNADHGATGGVAVLAYADGRPFEPTFMLHEMGHVMGFDHSFGEDPLPCAGGDARPGAYCDVFDLMSAMNVRTFADSTGRRVGPGLSAPNLVRKGWLHRSRIVSGWPSKSHEFQLAALNRPDVDGPLALRFGGWPFRPDQLFVEFRVATGWDRGIGAPAVILHTVGSDGLTRLATNSGKRGRLFEGEEIVLSGLVPIVLRVVSIDPAGHATVRVWPLTSSGPRGVRLVSIDFNPSGPDILSESVLIRNETSGAVDLAGWQLSDLARHSFVFPSRMLDSGSEVTVWTGVGTDDATNVFWGRHQAVWNNTGDTATLRRPDGSIAGEFAYGDGGHT
jgi:hypothetical protein